MGNLMNRRQSTHYLLGIGLLIAVHNLYGDNATISKTKQHLQQLTTKITQLKQTLNNVHDKRVVLNREMAHTEQEIQQNLQKLRTIEHDIEIKERDIHLLEPQINALNLELQTQQQQLANHLRIRYKIGTYQPLKWILNQDKPQSADRLLTYYKYILRAQQKAMDTIRHTQKTLHLKKEQLNHLLQDARLLEQQWHKRQQQLTTDKRYHATLIQSLNHEIQNKQQTLTSYQQDHMNLTRLLTTLTRQSVLQTKHPFTQMKRKLIKPVNTTNIHTLNQGLLFNAPEGTTVHAIYPGKIVFSDWLNGYGYLLIIDHGWGFMTLYAHNHALFKRKGDTVNQGDNIASVGHTGTLHQNGLYFEIRHHGKVTPPLEWLTKT